jgi:hypothetical protein
MDSLSFVSNNHGTENSNQTRIIEDGIVHQIQDHMDIEGPSSPHSGEGQEEQGNVHFLLSLNVLLIYLYFVSIC